MSAESKRDSAVVVSAAKGNRKVFRAVRANRIPEEILNDKELQR